MVQDAQRDTEAAAQQTQRGLKRKLEQVQEKLDISIEERDKLNTDLSALQAALARKVLEMNDAMHAATKNHQEQLSSLTSSHKRETEDNETTHCRRIAALTVRGWTANIMSQRSFQLLDGVSHLTINLGAQLRRFVSSMVHAPLQRNGSLQATLEDVRTESEEKYDNLSQAYGELKIAWDNRGAREADVERIDQLTQMVNDRDEQISGFERKYSELRNVCARKLTPLLTLTLWTVGLNQMCAAGDAVA